MEAGVGDEALAQARDYHRRAMLRWDFVYRENSMGFHAPQEAARILADGIDCARRAELSAARAQGVAAPQAAAGVPDGVDDAEATSQEVSEGGGTAEVPLDAGISR